MRTIVDLHMHSHFSRATSKKLNISGIAEFGAIKGVDLIATGDITHPLWLDEISRDLEEDGSGFLYKKGNDDIRFALFGEVASVYSRGGQGRRVHTLFGVSSIAAAKKVNNYLEKKGYNIRYDGRPIIGMDVRELAKVYLDADSHALIIPAHIWTPWFAMFGSKSGFDSLEECFGDMTKHIFAIETGLSSDPEMNWRISDLNDVAIISNSDAHSPPKIGREATVYDWDDLTYDRLYASLKEQKNILYTIEFFPEEGKYHLDGHRKCGVRFEPEETIQKKGICPKCRLPLVIGVMNRVNALTDQTIQDAEKKRNIVPFKSIIPLPEIIANAYGIKSPLSKKVQTQFEYLISSIGNEFHILLDASMEEVRKYADPIVALGIERMRSGNVHIVPGYDGEFGGIEVFDEQDRNSFQLPQGKLF